MAIRAITGAAAIVVAIVTALAVPVASLRLVSTVATCCCPDPSSCHCPDHEKAPASSSPQMRQCHRNSSDAVSPELPPFEPPVVAVADAPACIAPALTFEIPTPHVAPAPARPAAPS